MTSAALTSPYLGSWNFIPLRILMVQSAGVVIVQLSAATPSSLPARSKRKSGSAKWCMISNSSLAVQSRHVMSTGLPSLAHVEDRDPLGRGRLCGNGRGRGGRWRGGRLGGGGRRRGRGRGRRGRRLGRGNRGRRGWRSAARGQKRGDHHQRQQRHPEFAVHPSILLRLLQWQHFDRYAVDTHAVHFRGHHPLMQRVTRSSLNGPAETKARRDDGRQVSRLPWRAGGLPVPHISWPRKRSQTEPNGPPRRARSGAPAWSRRHRPARGDPVPR